MKRLRHLEQCDYIVPIGQSIGQILTLSNCSNVVLERIWDQRNKGEFELKLHAKFDSSLMNGIQIMGYLIRDQEICSSSITQFSLYRVADGSWTETFISNVTATQSGQKFTGYINQTTLSTNELSGAETYAIECVATRKRRTYKDKIWFNHLGCFDSIIRLRHSTELLESNKVDE